MLSLIVFALALYWALMELEVDSKQILRNHHTRPPTLPPSPFLMKSLLVLEGKGECCKQVRKTVLSVGWYCVFNEMQAKILAINNGL